MATWEPRANELFLRAADVTDPADRAALLERECANDPALRRQVESLLDAGEKAGSFLGRPAAGPVAIVGPDPDGGPGTVIGPYKLLEQIGEGGFGVVYLAEQAEPVRRRVALKVIKPGMDSKQVVTRFEAERQALALMDHPNIAKILDGGQTGAGRPYFVMELVKGVPVTDFCDRARLGVRDRLAIFADVCMAVQHAHTKGVIHRDIKPSNVLVALHDDRPVAKVIDFGVAKALGQSLTDRTLFTGFAQMVGTPLYMSPEQAQMSGLDVDTRSDVYSLGVLLYELLTGTTPFDRERFRRVGYDEVRRIIREEEPAKPSARLSTLGPAATTASANRGSDPRRLSRLFRGELDWVVMRALEKDRDRRYESPGALAADVGRYLADEPVQACPPSAWYRARKFTRRHKAGLAVAGLVLLFVVALGGGVGWVVRDRAARQARAADELERDLDRAELFQGQGKRAEALAALDRAALLAGQAPPDAARDARLAAVRERLDADDRDEVFAARFEEIRLRDQSRVDVKESRFAAADGAAFPELRDALDRYGVTLGVTPPAEVAARIGGRPEPAQRTLVAALDDCLFAPKADPAARRWLPTALDAADGDTWRRQVREAGLAGDRAAVERLARGAEVEKQPPSFLLLVANNLPAQSAAARLELLRRTREAHPADLWANLWLADELTAGGRPAEAVRYYTAALALRPNNPGILVNRGLALQAAEETAAAVVEYQRALAIAPDYAVAHNNLGGALRARGRLPEAIEEHRQAIRLRKGFPEAHTALGTALYLQGRLDDAAAAFREAVRIKPEFVKARRGLGLALYDRARFDDAVAAYREAVRIKPDYAEAHYNLGQALGQQGEFREALAALGRGHELGSKRPGWRDAEGRSIRQCERLIELEERLPGHLNGENTPAGPGERVELAVLCTLNRLHAAAAKFYADAFAEEPRLAEDLSSARHRHNAALAAALAGCGSGRDAGGLDAAERARLRRRALDWPRADLAARERLPEPARAAELVAALRHWLADPALAGVRDPEKLLRLPEAERPPWREFWGRVGDTLARAEKASDAN